jgi:uncharacterized protein
VIEPQPLDNRSMSHMMRIFTLVLLLAFAAVLCLAMQPQSKPRRTQQTSRQNDDALISAVKKCDVASTRILLGRGADVNTKRYVKTPLMLAAETCDLAMVKALLARGADPSVVTGTAHAFFTPLGCAIRGKASLDVIDALISAGAQLNPVGGISPLYFALEKNDLGRVKALLARGADVNLRGFRGVTPLMLAAIDNSPEVVEVLLAAGADVNAKSDEGDTALSIAIVYRDEFKNESREEIILMLKRAGAQEKK